MRRCQLPPIVRGFRFAKRELKLTHVNTITLSRFFVLHRNDDVSISRAVFVVDIVSIVLTLLGTILFLAGAEAIQGTAVQSDDETVNDATVAFQNAHRGPIVVVLLVSVVCYAAGVYGALQFAPPFVWTAAICHVVAFIGNLASLNVIGVILEACFVYPHAVFIREMRAGVMTPDNYVNEVHSCCCV